MLAPISEGSAWSDLISCWVEFVLESSSFANSFKAHLSFPKRTSMVFFLSVFRQLE